MFQNFFLVFSEKPVWQSLIFGLFLSMYLLTLFGNLLTVLAVSSDFHLHMPMYFFLSNQSFVDISFTSTTIPKMLWNIQTQRKVITYEGCITQVYFFTLYIWMTFSWLWWSMTALWPSASPCTTKSSWTPVSVDCWFWLAGSSVPWIHSYKP